MLSRRSISLLIFVGIFVIILLGTSRHLGQWSIEESYRRLPVSHDDRINDQANNHSTSWTGDLPFRPHDPLCDAFPDTSDILLVMKTGASEAYDRIPTQLMTMLKCLPDFLLFSDMDQHIAGYHIRDSLDTVIDEAKAGNTDFDLYRRQRACSVDQDSCNKLSDDKALEGWNLDKYKNVHMAEKAYALRPGYKWYVFVDADTYVLWPTLVQWLRKLNHRKKHYLGSVTLISDFEFGHGGSGYIVSQAAMEEFVGRHPGVGNQWDMRAKDECCGDYIFGLAMKNTTNVGVRQVWPTINGEKPNTLPFGPSHWCQPIVTMHHMNSEEISTFWDYEMRRYAAESLSDPPPLRIKDIYHEFLAPKLTGRREDWDNLSDDVTYLDPLAIHPEWKLGRAKNQNDMNEVEKLAHMSLEHCARACESLDDCFQYKYEDRECKTSWSFKMGHPVKRESEPSQRSLSGWDINKINKWIKAQGECRRIEWPST